MTLEPLFMAVGFQQRSQVTHWGNVVIPTKGVEMDIHWPIKSLDPYLTLSTRMD